MQGSLLIATSCLSVDDVKCSLFEVGCIFIQKTLRISIGSPYQQIISDDIMDFLTGSDIVQQLDEPMTKQPKLSRFDQDQLTSSPLLAKSSMGVVPPNTRYNTQWALNTFNSVEE